ncbi:MAG: glycosyltransferase [Drouetiella hepatica Uher 2000/2452]|jgi:GT2 family glycosyltransferase|uniref:Glycosyltransferase n=1 Tax=Drouetiella hepatica Uher 2000/2452 TaxID=904376 RepID=A0A951UMX9_9CYAN|nr:glycosyltransferase [Drouetiella hepatica Uher 2000/2452]
MTKVYILLPVHNRREITLAFIKFLKAQTYSNYQLILIDDGSTDGTAEAAVRLLPSVIVIRGQGDWWWAGGLQQGINWIKSSLEIDQDDIVLMMNDDVHFEEDFIEKGVRKLTSSNGHLLKAEGYSLQTQNLVSRGVRADLWSLKFREADTDEEVNCLDTRGLFMKVSTLLKIGDFYPKFLPHYLSDYEFTIRAYKKGLRLFTDPDVRLWINEQTTGPSHFKELDFLLFFRRYFSKRSVVNPLYYSSFAILSCPKIALPFILLKIWWGGITTVIKRAVYILYWSMIKKVKHGGQT